MFNRIVALHKIKSGPTFFFSLYEIKYVHERYNLYNLIWKDHIYTILQSIFVCIHINDSCQINRNLYITP